MVATGISRYALKPVGMARGSEDSRHKEEIWRSNHGVEASKLLGRHRLDFLRPSRLAEGGHAGDANLLHCIAGRLEIIARIEFFGRLGKHLSNGSGDREPIVGINIYLAHTVLDASLNFFDGDAPRLLELAAIFVDDVLQVL